MWSEGFGFSWEDNSKLKKCRHCDASLRGYCGKDASPRSPGIQRPIMTGLKYRQARSASGFWLLLEYLWWTVFIIFLPFIKPSNRSVHTDQWQQKLISLFSTALRYTNTSHNENFCSRGTSETITLSQKSVMKSDTALTPQCMLCRTELHNTCYHVLFLAVGCKYKYPLPTLLMGFHLTHTNPHICT